MLDNKKALIAQGLGLTWLLLGHSLGLSESI
jgi:hypothetical protein